MIWLLSIVALVSTGTAAYLAMRPQPAVLGTTLWQDAVDHTVDAVVVVDANGRIAAVSKGLDLLLGLSPERVLGKPFSDLIPAGDARPRSRTSASGTVLTKERTVDVTHRDRHRVPLLITSHPFTHEGQELVAHVLRDHTSHQGAIKRLNDKLALLQGREQGSAKAAAKAATRSNARFLSQMSASLQRPANTVLSHSGRIAELTGSGDTERAEVVAEELRGAGAEILNRLTAMVDLLRVESGHVSVYLEQIATRTVVHEVISTVAERASRRGVTVVGTPPELQSIRADPTMVRQILLNLLQDAVGRTAEGEVSMAVRDDSDGGARVAVFSIHAPQATIELSDEARLQRVVNGDDVGAPELGLTIAGTYARAQGGHVLAKRRDDSGLDLILTLPLYESDEDEGEGSRERVVFRGE